jgi:hypothetical protein
MSDTRISMESKGPRQWQVTVQATTGTSHLVTVPPDYLESLGLSQAPPERILEESFQFLLEHEPNTSILREFSLPVIERYFAAYPGELKRRLAGKRR